jgi:NhaP-type Na+/H+ or K+/H+ antiporter
MAGRQSQSPVFNGFQVLWAALIGCVIGVVLAFFLDTFIRNTPADLSRDKLLYLYAAVVVSATLFAASIESIRQLQVSALEGEYRAQARGLRQRGDQSD